MGGSGSGQRPLTTGNLAVQYLESVRPLLDDEEFYRMEKLAKDFQDKTAGRLQRFLILKSWWATNYVSSFQFPCNVPHPCLPSALTGTL